VEQMSVTCTPECILEGGCQSTPCSRTSAPRPMEYGKQFYRPKVVTTQPIGRKVDRHANWKFIGATGEEVKLQDIGPWDKHLSITNDPEWVTAQCIKMGLGIRKLLYLDTGNEWTELLHNGKKFTGFGHDPDPEPPELKDRIDQLILNED